jgi:hypothetical protein
MAASEWLLRAIEAAFGSETPRTGQSGTPSRLGVPQVLHSNPLKSFGGTPGTPGTPKNIESCKKAERTGYAAEQTEICLALRRALAREIWAEEGERAFVIDTSVRAIQPLLDQVPVGIDPQYWRRAVEALNEGWVGRVIPRGYDQQPVLTIPGRH